MQVESSDLDFGSQPYRLLLLSQPHLVVPLLVVLLLSPQSFQWHARQEVRFRVQTLQVAAAITASPCCATGLFQQCN